MNYVKVVNSIEDPEPEGFLTSAGTQLALCCPDCGHGYSHVQAVYTLLGGDEGGTLYRGSHLVARETPYRRDALAVRVLGECGHRWDFVFQQHKGETFIRIDMLEPDKSGTVPKERVL